MTYLTHPPFPWLPLPPNTEGNPLFINKNNHSKNTESRTLLLLRQPNIIKKTDKTMLQIHAGLQY